MSPLEAALRCIAESRRPLQKFPSGLTTGVRNKAALFPMVSVSTAIFPGRAKSFSSGSRMFFHRKELI